MDRFPPEQRDCYSEGEIELKYLPRDHGYRYEMSNCLFEATFEHILEVWKLPAVIGGFYMIWLFSEVQMLSWIPYH